MAKTSLLHTVVRSLRFDGDHTDLLNTIPSARWQELLALTDEAHITLPLAVRCGANAPGKLRELLESRLVRNAARHTRIVEAHAEFASAMNRCGADYVLLKGLTHSDAWTDGSACRPQYDIDLYCPPDSMSAAIEAVTSLGYGAAWPIDKRCTDHLPVMIRRSKWAWRNDYYDAEQPLALELHHRFWTPSLGVEVHGREQFWNRRRGDCFEGLILPALCPTDRLTYATWHAVRHLLGGGIRVSHIYEIARFLHYTAKDEIFWLEWSQQVLLEKRIVESIAFRLAKEWFGCRMNPVTEACIANLPPDVERWFGIFARSPIQAPVQPNKDELLLHLCLVKSRREARRIVRARLFPLHAPTPPVLSGTLTPSLRMRLFGSTGVYGVGFVITRAWYHFRVLGPVVRSASRWWLSAGRKTEGQPVSAMKSQISR